MRAWRASFTLNQFARYEFAMRIHISQCSKRLVLHSARPSPNPLREGEGIRANHLLTIHTCAPGKPLSVGTRRTTQMMV
jgi:hypothetical protein